MDARVGIVDEFFSCYLRTTLYIYNCKGVVFSENFYEVLRLNFDVCIVSTPCIQCFQVYFVVIKGMKYKELGFLWFIKKEI